MPGRRRSSVVFRWLWPIVLSTAMGAVFAYLVSTQIQPTYTSQVTLLVGPSLTKPGVSLNDIQVGQALAETYAILATTRPVLERVIASTGIHGSPEALAPAVATRVPPGSNLLEITVTSAASSEAAAVANALAAELADFPPQTNGADPSPKATLVLVVDPALASTTPVSPRILLNTALGGAFGLAIALGLAFLVENLWRGDGEADEGR